jgi:hypothetical protein
MMDDLSTSSELCTPLCDKLHSHYAITKHHCQLATNFDGESISHPPKKELLRIKFPMSLPLNDNLSPEQDLTR